MGDERDSPKTRLRRALDARREAIAADEVVRASRAACERMAGLQAFREAAVVVLYAARRAELDPHELERVASSGAAKTFYYPRVEGDRLAFRQATFDELSPGRYGILEPAAGALALPSDVTGAVVVVPGLAFDRAGGRLGTGKGYYDRTLSAFPGLTRIGLAMDDLVVDRLPTDPWDVPMHLIVTEHDSLVVDAVDERGAGDLPWR